MKSIVFVKHWRLHDVTHACVASVLDNTEENYFIVVIDGSADEEPYTFPNQLVSVKPLIPNLGLIESFNRFIRAMDADLWVCLNNDVIVADRWLEAMIACIKREPRIGVIAPLYDQPGGGWLERSAPPPSDPRWQNHLDKFLAPPGVFAIYPHVDNCAWAFTKRLVDVIGLPDEQFTGAGWGANLDFCYRARKAGFLVAASLGSFVHHSGARTYGGDPSYRSRSEASRDEILRRKYGDPSVVW